MLLLKDIMFKSALKKNKNITEIENIEPTSIIKKHVKISSECQVKIITPYCQSSFIPAKVSSEIPNSCLHNKAYNLPKKVPMKVCNDQNIDNIIFLPQKVPLTSEHLKLKNLAKSELMHVNSSPLMLPKKVPVTQGSMMENNSSKAKKSPHDILPLPRKIVITEEVLRQRPWLNANGEIKSCVVNMAQTVGKIGQFSTISSANKRIYPKSELMIKKTKNKQGETIKKKLDFSDDETLKDCPVKKGETFVIDKKYVNSKLKFTPRVIAKKTLASIDTSEALPFICFTPTGNSTFIQNFSTATEISPIPADCIKNLNFEETCLGGSTDVMMEAEGGIDKLDKNLVSEGKVDSENINQVVDEKNNYGEGRDVNSNLDSIDISENINDINCTDKQTSETNNLNSIDSNCFQLDTLVECDKTELTELYQQFADISLD